MRHPNYRLVKIHRNYTVEEAAILLGVHKNTIRQWVKQGLPVSDGQRPMLFLGREFKVFLQARRTKNKRQCEPGEIYCVKCRAPKKPASGMMDYYPRSVSLGKLVGICPDCGSIMNQLVCLAKLELIQRQMDITFPQALRHIVESDQPIVNSDLK